MDNIKYFLDKVEKPGRYTGGEWGMVIKNPDEVKTRYAFCFPDTYEVGMSHLGIKILYSLLNEQDDIYCERVFAPWVDMEELMRENNVPLCSLETSTPLSKFDFLGFTLQYEMSFTNILNMLDLAHIPLLAEERDESYPLICCGGPCASNPEPMADFTDFFIIGEGEDVNLETVEIYNKMKENGTYTKKKYLEEIAKLDGIYVPAFYDVTYNEDGTIKSFTPNNENAKSKIQKRIVLDLDKAFYPKSFIVPNIDIVHDRIMLEVFRGCTRGCRFCQAGMIYRPVREKSPEHLLDCAKRLIDATGYEEMSLTSLSTSDYTGFEPLCNGLLKITKPKNINLSLPSLRIDNFSLSLMEKVKRSGLTFAPEAGTQRMRDVINKNITEEDIINSVSLAFNGGYSSVKLYFMMGLPTETDEDIIGISKLADVVANEYFKVPKENRGKSISINVSTSCFVPKPHTPFQWEPMDTMEELERKQGILQKTINRRCVKYNWHDADTSFLEAVFARGDRKLCKVLKTAFEMGCKLDSWSQYFDYEKWMKAFEVCGVNPEFYAYRKREYDEILPWDFIFHGVTKSFLISESKKSKEGKTTPQCREQCNNCGAKCYGGGVCFE